MARIGETNRADEVDSISVEEHAEPRGFGPVRSPMLGYFLDDGA